MFAAILSCTDNYKPCRNAISNSLPWDIGKNGNEWGIYVANENDGKPYSVHAARVVNTIDSNGEEKPVYLTVQISCSSVGTYWPDLDAFVKDLDVIAQCIHTAE